MDAFLGLSNAFQISGKSQRCHIELAPSGTRVYDVQDVQETHLTLVQDPSSPSALSRRPADFDYSTGSCVSAWNEGFMLNSLDP